MPLIREAERGQDELERGGRGEKSADPSGTRGRGSRLWTPRVPGSPYCLRPPETLEATLVLNTDSFNQNII